MWPVIKTALSIIGILLGTSLSVLLLLTVYNFRQHLKLTKAKQEVENTMLDLLAEFNAAIHSCEEDDRTETLERFDKLRADFEKVMVEYYSNPDNKPTMQ
jgi:uncharacterized membrane protein YgaE (UPF0421/DUF939 family)